MEKQTRLMDAISARNARRLATRTRGDSRACQHACRGAQRLAMQTQTERSAPECGCYYGRDTGAVQGRRDVCHEALVYTGPSEIELTNELTLDIAFECGHGVGTRTSRDAESLSWKKRTLFSWKKVQIPDPGR
jgi:hypothetical protein